MKKAVIIIIFLFICLLSYGQDVNLLELRPKQRDKVLVDIANKAINKYSTGYLRPGAVPIIQDLGPVKEGIYGISEWYMGVHMFAVYYRGTPEEHCYSWYNKDYLVKVYIRADNGRPTLIRYIDDADWIESGLDLDEKMNREREHKRRFVPIEEREEEKRNMGRKIRSHEMDEYIRKLDEHHSRVRDSATQDMRKRKEERLREARERTRQ